MDTAKKKWRISDTDISKILGIKIGNKVYFDKLTVKNMAHDAFGGPKELLIAITGKARYTREKRIQQLLPCISRNREFQKTTFVESYLLNGKGGVKGLLVSKWNAFVKLVESLPHNDRNLVTYDSVWFKYYIDGEDALNNQIVKKRLQEQRGQQWLWFVKTINKCLWKRHDEIEYVVYGDIRVFENILERQLKYHMIEQKIVNYDPHMVKYITTYCKDFLYQQNITIDDAIKSLKEKYFFHTKTTYKYLLNRYKRCKVPIQYDTDHIKRMAVSLYMREHNNDIHDIPSSLHYLHTADVGSTASWPVDQGTANTEACT